ncbi:MAG: phage holin family protein [Vulcanimicrobiaceae bacterium]
MEHDSKNPPPYAERSLPDLLRQLSTDTATLVRQEVQLARAELEETGKKAAKSGVGFGAAAIFGLGAFGALTTTLIAVIALALPVWVAALTVTVIYGVVAFVAALSGKKALADVAPPVPQTIATIKEDVAAVRAGAARGR